MADLPEARVGDPFPIGAMDDQDCPEAACRREPDHPGRHVAARAGVVTATW